MTSLLPVLSDILLFSAALGAGIYCLVLSRRLTRLSSIDKGLGGAIAVLSAQVDDMTKALAEARSGSEDTAQRLSGLMAEAESLANDLEVMLAACHDLRPDAGTAAEMRDALAETADPADDTAPDQADAPAGPGETEGAVQFGSRRAAAAAEETAGGVDRAPVFRSRAHVAEAAG